MNATNDLLSRCLCGGATAAEWELLDQQIAGDPVLARKWCEEARLDAELSRLLEPNRNSKARARSKVATIAAAAAVVAAGVFAVLRMAAPAPDAVARDHAPAAETGAQPAPINSATDSSPAEGELFDSCEALYLKDDFLAAMQQYELYLKNFPRGKHLQRVHYHLGECHKKLASAAAPESKAEHLRIADASYRASLSVSSTGPYACYSAYRLGSVAYNDATKDAAQWAEAAKWFAIAVAQAPKDPQHIKLASLVYLGRSQRELGRLKEAAASFEEVLKTKKEDNPYYDMARVELAKLKNATEQKADDAAPPSAAGQPAKFSRVVTDEKVMALTFDDGPHAENTPRLLGILKEAGVKATFFPMGQSLERYPALAKQTVAEGHELGNHSWTHPYLSKVSEDKFRDEIGRSQDKLREITGRNPDLFRPPYGAITAAQIDLVARDYGCATVLWSVDSMDWKSRNAEAVKSAVIQQAGPGRIVLLHEIHSATIDAVPDILQKLTADGWKFVTVAELTKLGPKANTLQPAPDVEAGSAQPVDAPDKKER